MAKVLLNWLPPSMENMPSPAHSVLKNTLEEFGYDVHIEYWNLKLSSSLESFLNFGNDIYKAEINKFIPFYAYLGVEYKQGALLNSLADYVLYIKPQLHIKGKKYIISEFYKFYDFFNEYIDGFIEKKLLHEEYLLIGFSSLFYQWIIATIIARKVKESLPDLHMVIGGFGTKNEASAFQRNFDFFDFVSWGEGEYSLKSICDILSQGGDTCDITNTLSVKGIANNNVRPFQYSNINTLRFNFTDYFEQVENVLDKKEIVLPIEGGRGCHWRKCHFCFLNTGYKSRTKSSDVIINEIRSYIEKYDVRRFLFLDNDIIGGDEDRFVNLLDGLIKLREEYNDFSIQSAEIITKGITYEAIAKMAVVNFEGVQIGYESPSSELLKKIEKKNTFASNLFFIKWATTFGICINGANIIRNLPEETEMDIDEGISNLCYMRFFLKEGSFTHTLSDLAICEASRYFKELDRSGILDKWSHSSTFDFLPKGYINDEDKFAIILDFMKSGHSQKWNLFAQIEKHYINNDYSYSLLSDNSSIFYRELYNGLVINELEFNEDEPYWKILCLCNKQIYSIDMLIEQLSLAKDSVTSIIDSLAKEKLLYRNHDYSEIVTIINIDKLK
ncbi:radical SAM protein [Prevotella sp. PINT]|jgi:Fe-S oxidoreductase|uniref:B12-binding domain-containing radical SAM protein n=1 Tax=Palleniella intestinalis TaxID=2736291 RepID=UPI00155742B2|nr:radical SAM protein [Palleniella intestinalis]NPD82321.1 radical SAM protein [Palleniella intestinalis]